MKGRLTAGLILAVTTFGGAQAAEQKEEGEFGVLVPGKGAEETYIYCSACHSERLVAQQGLTRERWDALLQWMAEEQGMPPIEQGERGLILDYLAQNYGPDRPNFPR